MRFCILAYLLSAVAGLQVVPDVQMEKMETGKNIFQRIGNFFNQTGHDFHDFQHDRVKAKSAQESREDSAASLLNVLKTNLPHVRELGAQLCRGKEVSLCEIRLKMFKSITDKIESGDVKVVEMLRKSVQLLHDFSHMNDNLRGAISSLTLYELAERPPLGMRMIADINPRDGNVDRYEWSEYMKAIYLFTLTDETAHALEKPKTASERLTKFVSWDLRDMAPPKPSSLQKQIPSKP